MKKSFFKNILKKEKKFDYSFFFLTLGLCIFGLFMIYEASSVVAYYNFSDRFYFLKDQFKWFIIGLFLLLIFSRIDYWQLYNLSLPALLMGMVLLMLVFIPGLGIKSLGASRWLNFGFLSFQPAEITKIFLILYLSAWLSKKENNRFPAFLLLMMIFAFLIMAQPDMGTTMIIVLTATFIYFISGAPLTHLFLLLALGVLGGFLAIKIAPYRLSRFFSFLNPQKDPLGASYHLNQILIALGSGGLFGLGWGKSRQKFAFLPETSTDSIFAIIAEETGFLGTIFLLIFYFLLFFRGYQIALKTRDRFGQILGLGMIFYLFIQTTINLGGVLSLIPLTGVPLPFISYGGSSLVTAMIAVGIILNLSRQ